MKSLGHYIIGSLRHLVIAVLFVSLFGACRDSDEAYMPSIEGHWRRLVPAKPPVEYVFRNGVVTQTTFFGSQPVAVIDRVYAEQADTLLIGGDVGDPQRRYLLRFIGSEVVEVTPIGADSLSLAGLAYWERL